MKTIALLLAVAGAAAGGCADTKLQVGLHTRSAVYANSLIEQEKGVMAILTAKPPRVGTLQGVSPGAPLRGLGTFASDAIRVGLHRQCPNATVLTGPATAGLAARVGKSRELGQLLKDDSLVRETRALLKKADRAIDNLDDTGPITAVGVVANGLF